MSNRLKPIARNTAVSRRPSATARLIEKLKMMMAITMMTSIAMLKIFINPFCASAIAALFEP